MAGIKALSLGVMILAATAGASGMWYVDDRAAKHLDHEVYSQLLKGTQYTKVDVHKIGVHGTWIDIHHDEDCGDLPSPEEKKAVAAADLVADKIFDHPAGGYTQADIDRNGAIQPFARFKDVQFMYSQRANIGESIDPITGTRTSPAFDWYVGSKLYHFASIPSLEQFVIQAERNPKEVPAPEQFIQS